MEEMPIRSIIERKRDGAELLASEWSAAIGSYVGGSVDDAQMAALAMAVVLRGISLDETVALTRALVDSGRTLRFASDVAVVDKHSSGGVGDVVSLIVVPLVSACGVRVAKLAGRSLGHTVGTIDKLEAIPGCRATLTAKEFVAQVEHIGCAIAAASEELAPAEERLYHLRDRTGTIASAGLIAASIMSKKIAGGADGMIFDIKCGRAAFMKKPQDAMQLAETLLAVAERFGKHARAIVSDMNEPLSRSIGTGLEAIKARDFLRGTRVTTRHTAAFLAHPDAHDPLRKLVVLVADMMLEVGGIYHGREVIDEALASGKAYERFVEMVEAQGGSREALEAMAPSPSCQEILAERTGYIEGTDAVFLGTLARTLTERDPFAGVRLHVRTGDFVDASTPLLELYGKPEAFAAVQKDLQRLRSAVRITDGPPRKQPLVHATM